MKSFLITFILCMSCFSNAQASCVQEINSIVSSTRNDIAALNQSNKTSSNWDETVFNDCVTWLENRSNYQQTCPRVRPEWTIILNYLKRETNPRLRTICNRSDCNCPDVINSVQNGGLPQFLRDVNEQNSQNSTFETEPSKTTKVLTDISV